MVLSSRNRFQSRKVGSVKDRTARFIEAARQLGADEDEDAFKAKLAQIARQKPKDDVPPMSEPVPPKAEL